MKLRFPGGKVKTLTLSYDDGVVQDIRLIEIMNKYGLKGTFNINSGGYLPEDATREKFYGRMKLSEAKELYIGSGHEVAVHTYSHPFLEKMDATEILTEIIEDRKGIERDYGVIARGMAYPFGTYNDLVVDILAKCNIAYSRTTKATLRFDLPENWLTLHPTCHHREKTLPELMERFVERTNKWGNPMLFYLWGHSYEFDDNDNWSIIENFAERMGGREDIWYATNIEIYDYVKAYNNLQTSFDKKIVHNPNAIDIWFEADGETVCLGSGETIKL